MYSGTSRILFLILSFFLIRTGTYAQTDVFLSSTAEINKGYKSKDRVLEDVLYLDSATATASMEFYLPKGKYVVYVIADTFSLQAVSFSLKGNSMEWETKDKDQRKIVSEGKGFKQKKWIISNPITATEKYGTLDFKVDDIMAMVKRSNARNQAQYEAKSKANALAMATRRDATASASYMKYENGAEMQINISAETTQVKYPWGAVKILVFER